MKLHDAILETLQQHGSRGMIVKKIADHIENHELFKQMANTSSQVSARINNYSHLFCIDASVYPRLIRPATRPTAS